MTPDSYTLSTQEESAWLRVLSRCHSYDFYHLPAYHRLAERHGDGTAFLFVHEEDDQLTALPLVLRPLNEIEGITNTTAFAYHYDCVSVYGYAGPVAAGTKWSTTYVQSMQESLRAWLEEKRVISLFSRLHPLIDQQSLLAGLGDIAKAGETVSIDLTLPEAEQFSRYRKSHRNEISRLARLGVVCEHDRDGRWLHAFGEIYRETMQRVGANERYFFEDDYFEWLMAHPSLGMNLFVTLLDGKPIAGGLFAHCGPFVEYHLAGTITAHTHLAPMKLVIDTVRKWAGRGGARILHLGGGVGSARDSLYNFKAGFGGPDHDFRTWRWVIDQGKYDELSKARSLWAAASGKDLAAGYFPRYRASAVVKAPVERISS